MYMYICFHIYINVYDIRHTLHTHTYMYICIYACYKEPAHLPIKAPFLVEGLIVILGFSCCRKDGIVT